VTGPWSSEVALCGRSARTTPNARHVCQPISTCHNRIPRHCSQTPQTKRIFPGLCSLGILPREWVVRPSVADLDPLWKSVLKAPPLGRGLQEPTVTLVDALRIVNARTPNETRRRFTLACGFTPLYLKIFLAAQLTERTVSERIDVEIGVFGDVSGTLQKLLSQPSDGVAVPLEWSDLDARLGWRSTHGWRSDWQADILSSVRLRLLHLTELLTKLSQRTSVVASLPTLPLPPMFPPARGQSSPAALELRSLVTDFASELVSSSDVRLVDSEQLDVQSPRHSRHDVVSDLRTGFPYRHEHSVTLASMLADLLRPAAPLKGLITDLDNTLWSGIVGEEGIRGVSWDLDHKTHAHAIYQEMLASLSELGVLIGVASKNDPIIAQQGLQREDLVVPREALFPVEANWECSSESPARTTRSSHNRDCSAKTWLCRERRCFPSKRIGEPSRNRFAVFCKLGISVRTVSCFSMTVRLSWQKSPPTFPAFNVGNSLQVTPRRSSGSSVNCGICLENRPRHSKTRFESAACARALSCYQQRLTPKNFFDMPTRKSRSNGTRLTKDVSS